MRGISVMTVGRKGKSLRLLDAANAGFAQMLRLEYEGKIFQVRLPLVGEFQIENALVAAGLAIATGDDAASVFAALEHLTGAKGRLERTTRRRVRRRRRSRSRQAPVDGRRRRRQSRPRDRHRR